MLHRVYFSRQFSPNRTASPLNCLETTFWAHWVRKMFWLSYWTFQSDYVSTLGQLPIDAKCINRIVPQEVFTREVLFWDGMGQYSVLEVVKAFLHCKQFLVGGGRMIWANWYMGVKCAKMCQSSDDHFALKLFYSKLSGLGVTPTLPFWNPGYTLVQI